MWRTFLSSPAAPSEEATLAGREEQLEQFNDAMKGLLHVLNDDLPTAESILQGSDSVFHLLGRGTTLFIKGLLSFESDILRGASRVLLEAGVAATKQRKRCLQDPQESVTSVYPVGSEFTICLEATQILRAILAIMDTNVTEALKGFYNVRRAYLAFGDLAQIAESEPATRSVTASAQPSSKSLADTSIEGAQVSSRTSIDDDEDDEFHDADEYFKLDGPLSSSEVSQGSTSRQPESIVATDAGSGTLLSRYEPSVKLASTTERNAPRMNPIDQFVHTGSSVGYGALLLGISLVPSIFATILKIVGFQGDRNRGLQLLWRGAEADDGYGSVGALIVFEYYNAIDSFCEIYTEELYPRPRLQLLLSAMRSRFPEGRLWMLYESHYAAADRHVERAIQLVDKDNGSPLKQMRALQLHFHSVYCMFLHRHEECRQSFEEGVALNERSHAVSYYVAGAASVALYRQSKTPEAAVRYAQDVERLFDLALSCAGQKRFLAKRIPFEVMIAHKVQKWKGRAKAQKGDLVDAVGVSPIDEALYFWNGHKNMPARSLEQSLAHLEWMQPTDRSESSTEPADEKAIRLFLRAVTLRNLEKRDEAKDLLRQVISMNHAVPKGSNADNWMYPLAHYEMAIMTWQELDGSAGDFAKLEECDALIEKVEHWEPFDMKDAFSIQLSMARDSIKSRMGGGPVHR